MYNNLFNFIALCGLSAFTFGQVDYSSEIQPIFTANCTGCHGNSGGFNLSSYSNLMSGSNNGAVITPYDHAASEIYNRITLPESSDQDMPPSGMLTQNQIDLIAQWIDEGALEFLENECNEGYTYFADIPENTCIPLDGS